MSTPIPPDASQNKWYIFGVPYSFSIKTNKKKEQKISWNYPVDIQEWCTENIKGRWTWSETRMASDPKERFNLHVRPFHIEDINDAVMFKLVWHDRLEAGFSL
jgi:hypothetical protein